MRLAAAIEARRQAEGDLGGARDAAKLAGDVLSGLGRYADAAEAFLRAAEPRHEARARWHAGETERALALFASVRDGWLAVPLIADLDREVGELLLHAGRHDEAVPWLEGALAGYRHLGAGFETWVELAERLLRDAGR